MLPSGSPPVRSKVFLRSFRFSGPVAAVEGAVLDGLGDVADGDVLGAGEVGDGAGYLEDAVVGAGGEALLLHSALQQVLGVGREFAVGSNLLCVHLRVSEDCLCGGLRCSPGAFGCGGEALVLTLAGGNNAAAN